jgi:hypothetical protein
MRSLGFCSIKNRYDPFPDGPYAGTGKADTEQTSYTQSALQKQAAATRRLASGSEFSHIKFLTQAVRTQ